jgi:hypothetical protein
MGSVGYRQHQVARIGLITGVRSSAGLESPSIKARYADLAETTFTGSPSDFGKFIADDTAKWANVIKFAGIKVE